MWEDFQLEWTPEDFGGLSITRIPIHYLWYPDIAILNRFVLPHVTLQVVSFDTAYGRSRPIIEAIWR